MEDKAKLIESLLEKATEYGKTSYKLLKFKALDKTSDVVSSIISRFVVIFIIASCVLFVNLGLALWLGEILGKTYYGFFVVAAFYVLIGIILHFFMCKSLKRNINNYIIKQVLK